MMHEKTAQFIAFCKDREPERRYNWDDGTVCALGQFNNYDARGWEEDFTTCNGIARECPQTFGALAHRLQWHFEHCT